MELQYTEANNLLQNQPGAENDNTYRQGNSFHAKSFVLMILVWLSCLTAGAYLVLRYAVIPGFHYPIWIAFPVVYFIYIGEALLFTCNPCVKCGCSAATCAYLRNVKSDSATEGFIASLKSSAPRFRMHVECYHYETYYRTEYYTDSNGNQQSRQVQETRKIVTHSATDYIRYGAWMDNSTNVRGLGQFRVVKIDLEKDYEYHDEETYQSFNYQRVHFRRSNDFDRYQSYSESYIVPGFTDFALCCRHGERPTCLHLCYYTLYSLFMLSHPYRLWMEKLSVKTDIKILKRVSADPMAMQQLPLVMQYQVAANLAIQTAVVYQELYGVPQPNMPTAVAQALPVATATAVVPTAYAVPVATATSVPEETSKEQREQMFAQFENLPKPAHVNVNVNANAV